MFRFYGNRELFTKKSKGVENRCKFFLKIVIMRMKTPFSHSAFLFFLFFNEKLECFCMLICETVRGSWFPDLELECEMFPSTFKKARPSCKRFDIDISPLFLFSFFRKTLPSFFLKNDLKIWAALRISLSLIGLWIIAPIKTRESSLFPNTFSPFFMLFSNATKACECWRTHWRNKKFCMIPFGIRKLKN